MAEAGAGIQIKHLVGSLAGGLLAGITATAFAALLLGANEATSAFKLLLVGSGILGMIVGVGDYRTLQSGIWIALLVALRVFLFWLGYLIAFAIKEALEVETNWAIIINTTGTGIGFMIGQLVHWKFLRPKFVDGTGAEGNQPDILLEKDKT